LALATTVQHLGNPKGGPDVKYVVAAPDSGVRVKGFVVLVSGFYPCAGMACLLWFPVGMSVGCCLLSRMFWRALSQLPPPAIRLRRYPSISTGSTACFYRPVDCRTGHLFNPSPHRRPQYQCFDLNMLTKTSALSHYSLRMDLGMVQAMATTHHPSYPPIL